MYLQALVKDRATGKKMIIEQLEYRSKSKFKLDLIGNGYIVKAISHKRDLFVRDFGYETLGTLRNEIKWNTVKGFSCEREKSLLAQALKIEL